MAQKSQKSRLYMWTRRAVAIGGGKPEGLATRSRMVMGERVRLRDRRERRRRRETGCCLIPINSGWPLGRGDSRRTTLDRCWCCYQEVEREKNSKESWAGSQDMLVAAVLALHSFGGKANFEDCCITHSTGVKCGE